MAEIKRYVVLNCPTLMGNRLCYSKVIRQCADCTDCVIKQVIEKCKEHPFSDCACGDEILQLFDIEVLGNNKNANSEHI